MKKNSLKRKWKTLQSSQLIVFNVLGFPRLHWILFLELAVHAFLFSLIVVWIEKLKTEAEISSAWVREIRLLGKSLFASVSFSWKIFQSAPLLTFFFSVIYFSLDVNGNRWPQLVGSFAVILALHFPAPVWALLLMTACHWNGDVQKYWGYIYKGLGKFLFKSASCFKQTNKNFWHLKAESFLIVWKENTGEI